MEAYQQIFKHNGQKSKCNDTLPEKLFSESSAAV